MTHDIKTEMPDEFNENEGGQLTKMDKTQKHIVIDYGKLIEVTAEDKFPSSKAFLTD